MKKQILALTFAGLFFSGQASAADMTITIDNITELKPEINVDELRQQIFNLEGASEIGRLIAEATKNYGEKGGQLVSEAGKRAIETTIASLQNASTPAQSILEHMQNGTFSEYAQTIALDTAKSPALHYAGLGIAALYLEPVLTGMGRRAFNFWSTDATTTEEEADKANPATLILRRTANPEHARLTVFNAQTALTQATAEREVLNQTRNLEEAAKELEYVQNKLLEVEGFADEAGAAHAGRPRFQEGRDALREGLRVLGEIRGHTHDAFTAAGAIAPVAGRRFPGAAWFFAGQDDLKDLLARYNIATTEAIQFLTTAAIEFERALNQIEVARRLELFPRIDTSSFFSFNWLKPSEMTKRRVYTLATFGALCKLYNTVTQ